MQGLLPLVYHPAYSCTFPAAHRFPMAKFRLLHSYLAQRGIRQDSNVFRPARCPGDWLQQVHCADYINRFARNALTEREVRRIGLPWSPGLVKRTFISPAGTLLASQLALTYGLACHLAGGTHHAHFDFGSGFCIFNDLALSARRLVRQPGIERVLIFDCDVHQGDGTARILADEPKAYTCSIHCDKNFPARKAQSDWDVALPPGTADQSYLDYVEQALLHCLAQFRPSFVLYDAGVDVYCQDPLGLFDISLAGIRERDRLVLTHCLTRGIPVATVIGGGYDSDPAALAQRHAIVVETAAELYRRYLA